jgi:hypothetical protein
MGLPLWWGYRAKPSIVDPYKSFVEQLAAASPEARSELQRYLKAAGREGICTKRQRPDAGGKHRIRI